MKWQIWSEGVGPMTGTEGRDTPAAFHGEVEARTFQEACDEHFKTHPLRWVNTNQGRSYWHDYDPKKLTYWNCRLFDNEADARKSHG